MEDHLGTDALRRIIDVVESARHPSAQPASLSDAQLVAACRAGDQAAWEELVDRFSRYVLAILRQGFRFNDSDAEDVFQEVFARIYQRLDRLRDDSAIRPWIAQLTRRLAIDRIRAAGHDDLTDTEPETAALDATLERLDEALSVRAALAGLSENCQDILDRFFVQDESYNTISETLDIPAGTIASRISRCLRKLREEIEGRNPTATPSGQT